MSAITTVLAPISSVRMTSPDPKTRRSANYDPPAWDDNFLRSLSTQPLLERETARLDELKRKVRVQFRASASEPLRLLELADALRQLGIRYHFEKETAEALVYVSANRDQVLLEKDLYSTSLLFRLLRENGFQISQDVFKGFQEENSQFPRRTSLVSYDPRGVLSLYEASYLAFEEELLLHEIKAATIEFLRELQVLSADVNLKEKVRYALELPLHWRFPRFHTMWFMDSYAKEDRNLLLLELAKLDFNAVQLVHRREIKEASRWSAKMELGEQLGYFRDRVVANFLWALSTSFDPQYDSSREWITKAICMLAAVDDTYDVYATLEELEMFTDIVERWDIVDIDKLPGYMQILCMALFNHVNDLIYHVLKDKKKIVTLHIRRVWVQICKAYLQEARWNHNRMIPTVDEYLNNAMISAGSAFILSQAYILSSKDIDINVLDWIYKNQGLTRSINLVIRFTNDMGGAKNERRVGFIAKTLECYMHQEGVLEKEARKYVVRMIDQTWKNINKIKFENPLLPRYLVDGFLDLARLCHCLYIDGDEYSFPMEEMRTRIMSMLFEQIPLDA